ncbi:hypothetical protein Tco_1298117, partial [Tanacetum coccineum]
MAPLPPRDQIHLWLHYQVNRVHILDFKGLTPDMRQDLAERMRMVYTRKMGRRIGDQIGLNTVEEMAEDGFGAYWDFLRGAPSYTYIRDLVRRLCHILISYNISGRGQRHEKVIAIDIFYLHSMDRGAANVPYLLAQYLFRHAEGKKSDARLFG